MEKMDYKTLLEFVGKYKEEATRIFYKLKEADIAVQDILNSI